MTDPTRLPTQWTPKVLIINDEPDEIRALDRVVSAGREVLFATSGEQALDLAKKEQPDLILLDDQFSETDAHELCGQLKENTEAIPVIFVTKETTTEDQIRALEAGGADTISRPIVPEIVRARIHVHLELKRSQDLVHQMATHDVLTGIPNRRWFEEVLTQEWRRGVRSQRAVCLIVADIDFFKAFNDEYGHTIGNQCLRRLARVIRGIVSRPADLVARYGGEAFVVLLGETDSAGGLVVAKRIQAAVNGLKIPHEDSKAADHVTLSMGVSAAIPSADQTPSALLEKADEALYQAKKKGRDRIEAAPEDDDETE